jgi:hypothetical protein
MRFSPTDHAQFLHRQSGDCQTGFSGANEERSDTDSVTATCEGARPSCGTMGITGGVNEKKIFMLEREKQVAFAALDQKEYDLPFSSFSMAAP